MQIRRPVSMMLALALAHPAAAQVHQALDVRIAEAPKIVRIGTDDQLVTNFI